MYRLSDKSAATLRAIQKLGEATQHEIAAVVDFDPREAITSLKKCGHIVVARDVMRQINWGGGVKISKPVNCYVGTEKGRLAIQNMEYPPSRETRKALDREIKKQELHKMEHFIIPDRDPSVKEMMAEIGGREVKITYGVNFAYEPYVPPLDYTRYKPMPIKGINAL